MGDLKRPSSYATCTTSPARTCRPARNLIRTDQCSRDVLTTAAIHPNNSTKESETLAIISRSLRAFPGFFTVSTSTIIVRVQHACQCPISRVDSIGRCNTRSTPTCRELKSQNLLIQTKTLPCLGLHRL